MSKPAQLKMPRLQILALVCQANGNWCKCEGGFWSEERPVQAVAVTSTGMWWVGGGSRWPSIGLQHWGGNQAGLAEPAMPLKASLTNTYFAINFTLPYDKSSKKIWGLSQRSANFLWIRPDSRYFRWRAIWSAFNAWEQPQIGCKWMGYIPLKRYLGILKFEFQVTISCRIILLLFFPSAT